MSALTFIQKKTGKKKKKEKKQRIEQKHPTLGGDPATRIAFGDMKRTQHYASPTSEIEEKMLLNLMQNDSVMPCQMAYVGNTQRYGDWVFAGCFGLWAHSFLLGINEAKSVTKTKNGLKIKDSAIEWVKSDLGTLSFNWYCHVLKIVDIDRVRREILLEV